MSRITPSQVIEAYQETGLDVVRGCVYDPVFHRSCALGALYCSTTGANYRNYTLTRWVEIVARALGIDESYAHSFAMGWDGNLPDQDTDIEAYADGAEAYDAVTLWRESQEV